MNSPILLCDGYDVRQFLTGKSNGDESSEEDDAAVFSGDSLPGDAAEEEEEEEEWCGDNPFRFYFVKQFAYDDPEIKAKINEADHEIYHCNSDRIHIANTLKSKRVERLSLVASIENLISSLESMSVEIDQVKKELEVEIYGLSEKLSEIKIEIELLEVQMACALEQRDKAFKRIKFLRIQRDKANAAFFHSRVVMKKAIELAASGNVRDLEELSNSEVDKFMIHWNNDKAFRDDYKKRILPSLDEQESRCDGPISDTKNGNETVGKEVKELKRFSTDEESDDDAMEFEKEDERMDEESMKEKEREEQLEKARLAMERKKKLHEKAAAKAAIRVKKEAEKKLKEMEKRAKKKKQKAAVNDSSASDVGITTETVTTEASEPKKEKLLNVRSRFSKQTSFRYKYQKKGNEAVLKAIMKRRKAYGLWVWTVSSTALALALALVIAFFYI